MLPFQLHLKVNPQIPGAFDVIGGLNPQQSHVNSEGALPCYHARKTSALERQPQKKYCTVFGV